MFFASKNRYLMFPFCFVVLFSLGSSFSFSASLVKGKGPVTIYVEGAGVQVPIDPKLEVTFPGEKNSKILFLSGEGLRVKSKALVLSFDVYVLASYFSNLEPFQTMPRLKAIEQNPLMALKLTLVRDLSAVQIREAFLDSFKKNEIDPDDSKHAVLKTILTEITEAFPKGSEIILVGEMHKTKQRLFIQLPQKTITYFGSHLVLDFWKIWFGIPSDGGIEELQPLLLKRVTNKDKIEKK